VIFLLRLLAGKFGPWLLGGAALIAVAGWAYAGIQTIRYRGVQADLEATKAQVAIDANRAQAEAINALKAVHEEEMRQLEAQMSAHREAVASARAENARLTTQLNTFEREIEDLHDEPDTHAYLSLPMPDLVLERLRKAQHRHETGDR
jgi:cell division protein FtsB